MEGKEYIHKPTGQTVVVTDVSMVWKNLPCGCCSEPTGQKISFQNTKGEDDFETVDDFNSPEEYFKEIV